MDQFPKIGIVLLSYHSEPYWERVIKAWQALEYPKDQIELVIVDNAHPQYGSSSRYITQSVMPILQKDFPNVTLLAQEKNLGFAGGNNVGVHLALEKGCAYVYLHNQDGFMEKDCLTQLVQVVEKDKTIGAAQSLVFLYPEINVINSAGNCFHYLGFGYSGSFRKKKESISAHAVREVGYASGASLLMRADLLTKHGLLDEDIFLYHEDLEYSLRLKSLGYKTVLVSDSHFFHHYNFSRNPGKYYLMERNRWAVLIMYYQRRTLLFILPMIILIDLGLLLVAFKQGWLKEKLRANLYWLKPSNWSKWLKKRKTIQANRIVSDKKLLALAVGEIVFEDRAVQNYVLNFVVNPVMSFYWRIISKII